MLPIALWITALLWLLPLLRRFRAQHLAVLGQILGVIEAHGRSGAADWCPAGTFLPDAQLRALIERAWREGVPLAPSLAAFRTALRGAGEVARSGSALWRIFVFRVGLALLIVALIRTALACAPGDVPPSAAASPNSLTERFTIGFTHGSADAIAVLLAIALLGATGLLLSLHLPKPWLGLRALTPAAYQWLAAYLFDSAEASFSPGAALATMTAREWRTGVSLSSEKKHLLMTWAETELERGRQAVRHLTDLLPLFELFGIGLPMLLLLLGPLSQMLINQAQQ